MALCLANSLIYCEDSNSYDQLVRYNWWYKKGYMSSTGTCFDIGAATSQSLNEFTRRQKLFAEEHHLDFNQIDFLKDEDLLKEFNVYCSSEGVAGNGALMRLAPLPLFFYQNPIKAVQYSGISGQITHGDEKAYDACRYFGALIVAALHGESKDQLLDKDFYLNHQPWFQDKPLHQDVLNISQGSFKKAGGYDDGIRGKGYIIDALEAALWAFWLDDDSFEKGVLDAINLGDDTDTTAAIYGQLAGVYYGYQQLPHKWIQQIYAQQFLEKISKWITFYSQKQTDVPTPNPVPIPLIKITRETTDPNTSTSSSSDDNNNNNNITSPPIDSNPQYDQDFDEENTSSSSSNNDKLTNNQRTDDEQTETQQKYVEIPITVQRTTQNNQYTTSFTSPPKSPEKIIKIERVYDSRQSNQPYRSLNSRRKFKFV